MIPIFAASPEAAPIPECLACGACCFSDNPRFLPVIGHDFARLGDDADRWVDFQGQAAFMRLERGHCATLAIEPAPDRFICRVYLDRPGTCRTLERGSSECAAERHAKGLRASEAQDTEKLQLSPLTTGA